MIGTTLGDMYELPLGTYDRSDLGSSEFSADGNIDGKFEVLLIYA